MSLKRGQIGSRSINKELAAGPVLPTYTVAELATLTAADHTGRLVRCSDGDAGSPCLAMSDGAAWLRIVLGAAVVAA